MQNEKLRETVAELEQALSALDKVDESTRQRLQTAVAEIREALQDEPPPSAIRTTLVDRLYKAVEDFEESHPTLVTLIGRLADGLSQMGI